MRGRICIAKTGGSGTRSQECRKDEEVAFCCGWLWYCARLWIVGINWSAATFVYGIEEVKNGDHTVDYIERDKHESLFLVPFRDK